ncbi:hypothetical protein BC832DRAFT_21986 [Gaertneriomyces semiglobifer]|nr:hypothetical protein BC832DRAFT_21986 [Gaertneriomyces semiglobifer]
MPAVDWTISLCIIGGALLAFQAGINGTLNVKARSGIFASLWSFMSGLIPLIFYWLGESKGGKETDFRATYQDAPLYAHWGGVMGCGYVLMICFLAPRLGAATILATAVASQMAAALIMDHFGWLGLEQREATAGRIIGVLLTIVGVALIMGGFAYVKGLFTSKPKDVPAQQPRKSNSLESDVEKGSDIGIVPVNPKLGSFDWTIIFAVLGGIALAFQAVSDQRALNVDKVHACLRHLP